MSPALLALLFTGLPVRLLPRSVFDEVERETVVGLERFKALAEG